MVVLITYIADTWYFLVSKSQPWPTQSTTQQKGQFLACSNESKYNDAKEITEHDLERQDIVLRENNMLRKRNIPVFYACIHDRPKAAIFKSFHLLKSPIFWVHLIMFSIGNCSVALGVNLVNDIIRLHDAENFDSIQQAFEWSRISLGLI